MVKLCILIYSMVLFSIVLSFFCVLIFYCFNKRISVSPKPGMVYHCHTVTQRLDSELARNLNLESSSVKVWNFSFSNLDEKIVNV